MNEAGTTDEAGWTKAYLKPRATTRGASSTWSSTIWPTRDCTRSGRYGDPGPPAAALLVALGIEPAAEGNRQVMRDVRGTPGHDPDRRAGRLIRRFPAALHVSC